MQLRLNALPTALLLAIGLFAAHPASAAKRLVEMGWDEPNPAFMRAHLAQLEATPFDGCVYHLGGPRGDGQLGAFSWFSWGTRAFTEKELAAEIADLEATPFKRFDSNFLRMNVTPGKLDWFDDHAVVLSNLTLAASIARRGGSAGVLLDTEQYEGRLFSYPDQRDHAKHSYVQYATQARKRGGEVMRALEKGYPGLAVFLTLGVTQTAIQTRWEPIALEKGPYGLLAPFVDGMVLAASDSAKVVDGLEAAYPSRTPAEIDQYVAIYDTMVTSFVSDPVRYHRKISRSWGLWLDHDWRNRGWSDAEPGKNYRTPAALEATVRRALQLADDYVWVYSETPRWWTASGQSSKLPPAYDQALRNARKGLAP